jgi:hypothetical protein
MFWNCLSLAYGTLIGLSLFEKIVKKGWTDPVINY